MTWELTQFIFRYERTGTGTHCITQNSIFHPGISPLIFGQLLLDELGQRHLGIRLTLRAGRIAFHSISLCQVTKFSPNIRVHEVRVAALWSAIEGTAWILSHVLFLSYQLNPAEDGPDRII